MVDFKLKLRPSYTETWIRWTGATEWDWTTGVEYWSECRSAPTSPQLPFSNDIVAFISPRHGYSCLYMRLPINIVITVVDLGGGNPRVPWNPPLAPSYSIVKLHDDLLSSTRHILSLLLSMAQHKVVITESSQMKFWHLHVVVFNRFVFFLSCRMGISLSPCGR